MNLSLTDHTSGLPHETLRRYQWWDVTGTVGGFILAGVTALDGLGPILTWSAIGVLAAYRFLAPGYKVRNEEDASEGRKNKTRKAVDMGKSVVRELAKAAPIAVLFHTVGIDALSL